MAVNLSPYGGVGAQFLDNAGNVLTGGKIFTYGAGTTTNQVTYTTSAGNIPHSNPIILDASGRVPSGGEIWLTDGLSYKFILRDANDVLIATYDNVTGINSNFVAFTNQQEIQTATAGQTVFNLITITYQPGTNSLSVFVDGVNQYGPGAQYAYLETDSDTVTFVNGLHVGAEVKFTTSQLNSSGLQANAFQVSYTPPFTNSVGTNVGDKLAQTVSVKDFGAVGDGVADDTTAIQDAADYIYNGGVGVYGGELYFPQGTYKITSAITISQRTLIKGSGKGSTVISAIGCSGFYAANSVRGTFNINIRDISIGGDGTGVTKHGIELVGDGGVNVAQVHLENILVGGFSGSGVYIFRPIVTEIEQVVSSFNAQHGFHIIGDGTSLTMTSCWGRGNTGDGYRIDDNMQYCTFNGCAADGNANGYNFNGSIALPAQNIVLNGCGSEDNSSVYFLFTASQGVTLNSISVFPNSPAVGSDFIKLDGVRNASLNGILMQFAPASGFALNIGTLGGTQFPDNITSAGCTFFSVNNAGSASVYVDLNNALVTTEITNNVISGYNGLIVTHSLGKVPTVVLATPQSNTIFVGTDLYTSTTFRLLMRDNAGVLVPIGSPVNVAWMAK
jgi:hypothetical protein